MDLEKITEDELLAEIDRGGRFVVFQYCISGFFLSWQFNSQPYFIYAGEKTFAKSIGYNLISLFLGWWGFPSGPFFTIESLVNNLHGGVNVTDDVLDELGIKKFTMGEINPEGIGAFFNKYGRNKKDTS